jgi:hypothetical protein
MNSILMKVVEQSNSIKEVSLRGVVHAPARFQALNKVSRSSPADQPPEEAPRNFLSEWRVPLQALDPSHLSTAFLLRKET